MDKKNSEPLRVCSRSLPRPQGERGQRVLQACPPHPTPLSPKGREACGTDSESHRAVRCQQLLASLQLGAQSAFLCISRRLKGTNAKNPFWSQGTMITKVHISLAFCIILGTVQSLFAQPTNGKELVNYIRDLHKASRESIRECICRVEVTYKKLMPDEPLRTATGRYWRSGDIVRIKGVSLNGDENDMLVKDSLVRSVTQNRLSNGSRVAGASLSSATGASHSDCDAWKFGLLSINVPSTIDYVPFEKLLELSSRVNRAERRNIKGKTCIVVELAFDVADARSSSWTLEIHFDPNVNYLVRRVIHETKVSKSRIRREAEVLQFKEATPSVFFPEKYEGWYDVDGKRGGVYNATFSEIHINKPLPADAFRFTFPEGVEIADLIRKVSYKVDAQGRAISKEKAMASVPPPSAAKGRADESEFHTETKEMPSSLTRWILPASTFLLALAIVGGLVRRRRRLDGHV